MCGKRKYAARGRGQVDGLRREDAVAAARLAADEGSAHGLRDAALLRLGSDGLLRISELAGVQVDDLRLAKEGSGVLANELAGRGAVARYFEDAAGAAGTAGLDGGAVKPGP